MSELDCVSESNSDGESLLQFVLVYLGFPTQSYEVWKA